MQKTLLSLLALLALTLPCSASTTQPLAPLPTGTDAATLTPPADPTHFSFVMSGDNRAAGRNVPMPPTLDQICNEIRLLQPAFTIWTGDCIYGSDDSIGEAAAEYDVFLGSAARSLVPMFNAPGNHEIYDRPEMQALYEKRMGKLYGSFDYGNSHFIALNTEEIGLNGGIGKAQRDWLQQDLEANVHAAHIFVFMHHPLFPKPGEAKEGWADSKLRDDVHHLFVKYGVKYVFSGHEHLFYKGVHDGVNYIVSGGAGAPTDASPEEGGFQHYALFTVDGDRVTFTLLQPWRLFVQNGPIQPDGSGNAMVSNYNNDDLAVSISFASDALLPQAVPTASWSYKGKTHPLEATIVPSRTPGLITVRVVVPAHRAALVTLSARK